jgi:hypothetical protein
VRAFNPLAREVRQLFEALSAGEHHVRGFTNADIRQWLVELKALGTQAQIVRQQSAKVSRQFHGLPVYGLIAKVRRSRRWRISKQGLRVMSSSVRLRDQIVPERHASVNA